ncbi:TetR family transcriptional regulator [Streptomyces sp. NPDC004539]|uniref:TetR/AcrR family transcriptional regulator n=1 Tax=Streptomyces sp. NPDC004539 TaxID=3154280 RepID=UPI0033A98C44
MRKPAAVRRAEIIEAAGVEFAEHGLAGARLEAIAGRAGVSHPRVVQMFGSKRGLFLEVLDAAFDKVEAAFEEAERTLPALGFAYGRLLQAERTVGLVILHGYAAAADDGVREAVRERHLGLQEAAGRLTGCDPLQVRTFLATGLSVTVSILLDLPDRRVDAAWSTWLLDLAAPADTPR